MILGLWLHKPNNSTKTGALYRRLSRKPKLIVKKQWGLFPDESQFWQNVTDLHRISAPDTVFPLHILTLNNYTPQTRHIFPEYYQKMKPILGVLWMDQNMGALRTRIYWWGL